MSRSSSQPTSSRKTFKYRAGVLFNAGLHFCDVDRLDAFPSFKILVEDLLDTNELLTDVQMQSFGDTKLLPSGACRSGSGLPLSHFEGLLAAARLCKDISTRLKLVMGTANESEWRMRCHTLALATLSAESHGHVEEFTEEVFDPINLERVHIGPTRPDYTFGLPVLGNRPTIASLKRLSTPFLDAAGVHGVKAYVNENRRMVFPLVCAESKSYQGIPVEAENQCADDAIKMLVMLRSVGGSAASLPVFCISIIGSSATVYIVFTQTPKVDDDTESSLEFIMCELWSGDLRKLWEGFYFQLILARLGEWIRTAALQILDTSLGSFDSRVQQERSIPINP